MTWLAIPDDQLHSIRDGLKAKWKREGLSDKLPCSACGHPDYYVVPCLFQPEVMTEWPSGQETPVPTLKIEEVELSSVGYLVYVQIACERCGLAQLFLLGETLEFRSALKGEFISALKD